MRVEIEAMTPTDWINRAAAFTTQDPGRTPNIDTRRIYLSEHSPIRTRWLWIELYDIPAFVSTHFVRHKVGVEHFVKTGREDRGGRPPEETTRMSLVNHAMMANAQALITMARKRLCHKAHEETRTVMEEIKRVLAAIDLSLSDCLVPDCVYRGRCYELKPCGKRVEQGNTKS